MAVQTYFHNSVSGDRKYNADNFASHTNAITPDGVTNGLGVTSAGAYTVNVAVGNAIILGHSIVNTATLPLTVTSPVNGQVWSVVAQMDLNTGVRSGQIYLKQGALTSNTLLKEIALAELTVSGSTLTIVDKRIYNTVLADGSTVMNGSTKVDSSGEGTSSGTLFEGKNSATDTCLSLTSSAGFNYLQSSNRTKTTAKSLKISGQNASVLDEVYLVSKTVKREGDVISSDQRGVTIWTGSNYMHSGQTITPSIPLDQCPQGWMLKWENTVGSGSFVYTPIYKWMSKNSLTLFSMPINIINDNLNDFCHKGLTFTNTTITGNDNNDASGTSNQKVLINVICF